MVRRQGLPKSVATKEATRALDQNGASTAEAIGRHHWSLWIDSRPPSRVPRVRAEGRANPRHRFVVADPVHPIHNLDPSHGTPAGHEGCRERYIGVDGQRIVDDASRA